MPAVYSKHTSDERTVYIHISQHHPHLYNQYDYIVHHCFTRFVSNVRDVCSFMNVYVTIWTHMYLWEACTRLLKLLVCYSLKFAIGSFNSVLSHWCPRPLHFKRVGKIPWAPSHIPPQSWWSEFSVSCIYWWMPDVRSKGHPAYQTHWLNIMIINIAYLKDQKWMGCCSIAHSSQFTIYFGGGISVMHFEPSWIALGPTTHNGVTVLAW